MTLTGLIALIIYVVMFFPSWYIVGGALAWGDVKTVDRHHGHGRMFRSGDLIWAIAGGFFASLIWPVSLPVALLFQIGGVDDERAQIKAEKWFFVPTKYKSEVVAERAQRKERERKRLERETGMEHY